jgi:hypothetical protein
MEAERTMLDLKGETRGKITSGCRLKSFMSMGVCVWSNNEETGVRFLLSLLTAAILIFSFSLSSLLIPLF